MSSQIAFPAQIGNGAEEVERLNACALLGRQDLVPFFSPVGYIGPNGGFATILGGTGDWAWASGAVQLLTGATISSSSQFTALNKGSAFSQMVRVAGDWDISGRFSAVTVPTTAAILAIGFTDFGSNRLKLGVDFASQGSNFCLAGSAGSPINSGIPFDTNKHTFRAWHTGGLSFLQIDGGAVVSGTANVSVDSGPAILAFNGTAANQAMNVEWYFSAVPPL
jgi:hypothetical protein